LLHNRVSCIFAGVLVTLALVMISTINTTRARAGFDSQAESFFLLGWLFSGAVSFTCLRKVAVVIKVGGFASVCTTILILIPKDQSVTCSLHSYTLATIANGIPFRRYGRQSDPQQSWRRFGQGGIGTQAICGGSEIQCQQFRSSSSLTLSDEIGASSYRSE
jgi:hypothetical protein